MGLLVHNVPWNKTQLSELSNGDLLYPGLT